LLAKGFAGRQGVMLSLTGIAAILGLALTGKLELYIHPRYVPFTVGMAVLAATASVAAFILVPPEGADGAADGHSRGHPGAATGSPGRLRAAGSLLALLAAVVGLLVLPPATLSSEAARQRDLNLSGTLGPAMTSRLVEEDPSSFGVREWASLLRRSPGDDYFTGKTATVTGFVTAAKDDPQNVFYVTRFVVTCCTVDAQPVGVPVYRPGWQEQYAVDSWVTATGEFTHHPDSGSKVELLMSPSAVTATTEPDRPYVH
jgi:uncharacterized repeat protein (TIGR03943 family)